mgnify:FL=1
MASPTDDTPGAAPSPAAVRTLVCPGRAGSLDETFCRWLLEDDGVVVEPGGTHKEVVRRFSEATVVPPGLAGVVDRGGHPDDVLARHAQHVVVIPYFELESYLCHPRLLTPALRARDLDFPEDDLLDHLTQSARATYMPAVNVHLTHQPRPGGRARLELMAQQYADQLRRADELIAAQDVEALLRYFPGRRLASRLSRQLDFLSPQHVLETLMRVKDVRQSAPPLVALRDAILDRLSTA